MPMSSSGNRCSTGWQAGAVCPRKWVEHLPRGPALIWEPQLQGRAMSTTPFLTDIQTLRQRARQHIEQGAVTPGYKGDREIVIKLLNEALATEIVCTLRYKRHYFMAAGINAQSVAAEFQEHAIEEQQHADWIAERIVQLGGAPNFSPDGMLTRSHAEYIEGDSLVSMIKEDLVAER